MPVWETHTHSCTHCSHCCLVTVENGRSCSLTSVMSLSRVRTSCSDSSFLTLPTIVRNSFTHCRERLKIYQNTLTPSHIPTSCHTLLTPSHPHTPTLHKGDGPRGDCSGLTYCHQHRLLIVGILTTSKHTKSLHRQRHGNSV